MADSLRSLGDGGHNFMLLDDGSTAIGLSGEALDGGRGSHPENGQLLMGKPC